MYNGEVMFEDEDGAHPSGQTYVLREGRLVPGEPRPGEKYWVMTGSGDIQEMGGDDMGMEMEPEMGMGEEMPEMQRHAAGTTVGWPQVIQELRDAGVYLDFLQDPAQAGQILIVARMNQGRLSPAAARFVDSQTNGRAPTAGEIAGGTTPVSTGQSPQAGSGGLKVGIDSTPPPPVTAGGPPLTSAPPPTTAGPTASTTIGGPPAKYKAFVPNATANVDTATEPTTPRTPPMDTPPVDSPLLKPRSVAPGAWENPETAAPKGYNPELWAQRFAEHEVPAFNPMAKEEWDKLSRDQQAGQMYHENRNFGPLMVKSAEEDRTQRKEAISQDIAKLLMSPENRDRPTGEVYDTPQSLVDLLNQINIAEQGNPNVMGTMAPYAAGKPKTPRADMSIPRFAKGSGLAQFFRDLGGEKQNAQFRGATAAQAPAPAFKPIRARTGSPAAAQAQQEAQAQQLMSTTVAPKSPIGSTAIAPPGPIQSTAVAPVSPLLSNAVPPPTVVVSDNPPSIIHPDLLSQRPSPLLTTSGADAPQVWVDDGGNDGGQPVVPPPTGGVSDNPPMVIHPDLLNPPQPPSPTPDYLLIFDSALASQDPTQFMQLMGLPPTNKIAVAEYLAANAEPIRQGLANGLAAGEPWETVSARLRNYILTGMGGGNPNPNSNPNPQVAARDAARLRQQQQGTYGPNGWTNLPKAGEPGWIPQMGSPYYDGGLPTFGNGSMDRYAEGTGPQTMSYDNDVYNNLRALKLLRGEIQGGDYGRLGQVGTLSPKLGTMIPSESALNYGNLMRIRRDPTSYATTSSLFKDANRDLDTTVERVRDYAPIGSAAHPTMIRTRR